MAADDREAGGRVIVTVRFHGPFRVATGDPAPGLAATVDREELLPATTLKGLMRASAERLLPHRPDLVAAVFGAPRSPSPWHWGPAEMDNEPRITVRARVALDPATGAARQAHIAVAEEVTADSARFTIRRLGPLPPGGPAESVHLTLLACAAAGVHELGAGRSRGLGWVSCTTTEPALDDPVLDHLEQILAEGRDQ